MHATSLWVYNDRLAPGIRPSVSSVQSYLGVRTFMICRSSSSHEGSPFDVFHWARDYQQELQRHCRLRERDRARAERQRQGRQHLHLSECLDLGRQLPMGITPPPPLQTPSPLGLPTGSLSPMDLSALGEMSDIEDESNAILANLMSSSTPV